MRFHIRRDAFEDERSDKKRYIHAEVGPTDLVLRPEGCGDCCSKDGTGWPILLEFRDGVPFLVVWADINQEDPTHTIDLSGAAEAKRNKRKEQT